MDNSWPIHGNSCQIKKKGTRNGVLGLAKRKHSPPAGAKGNCHELTTNYR